MVGAAQIGQAGPNMEAMAKARGAAYYVYLIINKVREQTVLISQFYDLDNLKSLFPDVMVYDDFKFLLF